MHTYKKSGGGRSGRGAVIKDERWKGDKVVHFCGETSSWFK
jgi:hypothetical protein